MLVLGSSAIPHNALGFLRTGRPDIVQALMKRPSFGIGAQ